MRIPASARLLRKGLKMKKEKDTYPTKEQIDDFVAWVDDLGDTYIDALYNDMPEIIESMPEFAKKWTVKDLLSVIQDQL